MANKVKNPHPGEILKQDFLRKTGMSQNALAKAIFVPTNRIHAIINGDRDITADTDLRLCRFFDLQEGYFQQLQNIYNTNIARNKLGNKLARIQPFGKELEKEVPEELMEAVAEEVVQEKSAPAPQLEPEVAKARAIKKPKAAALDPDAQAKLFQLNLL